VFAEESFAEESFAVFAVFAQIYQPQKFLPQNLRKK